MSPAASATVSLNTFVETTTGSTSNDGEVFVGRPNISPFAKVNTVNVSSLYSQRAMKSASGLAAPSYGLSGSRPISTS